MTTSDDPDLTGQWAAVCRAVMAVVGEFPEAVARITEVPEEQSLTLEPQRQGAPAIELSNAILHEVLCVIAGTSFWSWNEDREELAGQVARIVRNVMLHGFIAAGETGRVPTSDGYIPVGLVRFTPWRWLGGKKVFAPFL